MAMHKQRVDKGLNKAIVVEISQRKNEPGWMTDIRLQALEVFEQKPLPTWGPSLADLDTAALSYYVRAVDRPFSAWEYVPNDIKHTFDVLGIPAAEQHYLAGVNAQYESEAVYHQLQHTVREQGVIFVDTDTGLREYEEIVKKFFATVVPVHDNKFAALNTAVWSGGSFVIVPAGVEVQLPLQAYFRMHSEQMGQFERTLIIAEPGSSVHYVEGCSAPQYTTSSLHSAVVEIIAYENSSVRYTTIQNWSTNVYNLVTKRAHAYKNAKVAWIDGNFGSAVTMKYPSVILKESGAQAHIISVAIADTKQVQDTGAKVVHLASDTSSYIVSKSMSKQGGSARYRGLVKVGATAQRVKARVQCDALLLDAQAHADAYPTLDVAASDADIGHEASVANVDELLIWFLMSRGLSHMCAYAMLVNGFIEPFTKELPMEYAVEINRLIGHTMEGSIG